MGQMNINTYTVVPYGQKLASTPYIKGHFLKSFSEWKIVHFYLPHFGRKGDQGFP